MTRIALKLDQMAICTWKHEVRNSNMIVRSLPFALNSSCLERERSDKVAYYKKVPVRSRYQLNELGCGA
jgi:hypothetical protein